MSLQFGKYWFERKEVDFKMENELQKASIDIGKKKLANLLGQVELTDEANALINQMAKGAITADEVIGKLGLSESTIDDLKEFAQIFSDVAQKEMEAYTRNKKTQNKINAMRKETATIAREQRDKEREALRQAEDAMLAIVADGIEKQRQALNNSYDRQIEDLKVKIATEKNLIAKAKASLNETIQALEVRKQQELNKLSDEVITRQIVLEQKRIDLMLSAVKSGSEQEYQLKMQQLVTQREMELSGTELTEQMKLAIRAKYDKQIDDLAADRESNLIKQQQDAFRLEFETKIAQAYGNEQEILRIKMEQKEAELNSLQRLEGESIEAFDLRKIQMGNSFIDAKKELAAKEAEIEQSKFQAVSDITNGLGALAEAAGEHSKGLAIASKVLALAEIAINTGKAIAAGIAQAQSVPFSGNIAAIATTISTILANIATATKTVKSVKFATGGAVVGPGSGTSDSIPAQLSNGESVMTAVATSMFAPILSSFNMMSGGAPINVTPNSGQTIGEDMLARAIAKGFMMAPAPVLSVEEFTSVVNRTKYVENLGDI